MLFADQRDAPSAQLNTSLPGYNYDIDTEGTPILQLSSRSHIKIVTWSRRRHQPHGYREGQWWAKPPKPAAEMSRRTDGEPGTTGRSARCSTSVKLQVDRVRSPAS